MADITGQLQAAAGVSTGNPNAWDISKAAYDAGADAWDISKAKFNTFYSVATQESTPTGLAFKSDGMKFYVVGYTSDSVHEYDVPAPWTLRAATFVQSFSIASQEITPEGLFFKPDGTKMYICGTDGDDVNEYDLSTPWDISTASYVQNFSVAAQETTPKDVSFKPDGTKMYVIGSDSDSVNEYSLSTPWDISTSSYVQAFSIASQETAPTSVFFGSDGAKMYVIGSIGDDVNEYDLSTPWDVSTASYVQNFSVAGQDTQPQSVFFSPTGSHFFVSGNLNGRVYSYTIGGFDVSVDESAPNSLAFKPDGTKMYVLGQTGDDVNEYNLSTAWDITTVSYVQAFSIAAQESIPTGLFFRSDGLKMYICGASGDDVNEYTLSVAWDVSTASYVQNFSVATEETFPADLFFKDDGTKMYVLGSTGDDVNEYSLSTAWDISTASYSQNFSVASEEATPTGLFFKPDGTKMYVIGSNGDDVNQYDLSTPWDISTASYVQNLFVYELFLPQGIAWNLDGSEFFIVGQTMDSVYKFSISPE